MKNSLQMRSSLIWLPAVAVLWRVIYWCRESRMSKVTFQNFRSVHSVRCYFVLPSHRGAWPIIHDSDGYGMTTCWVILACTEAAVCPRIVCHDGFTVCKAIGQLPRSYSCTTFGLNYNIYCLMEVHCQLYFFYISNLFCGIYLNTSVKEDGIWSF